MNIQADKSWKSTVIPFIVVVTVLISATAFVLGRRKSEPSLPTGQPINSACKLALIQHSGPTSLDQQIANVQKQIQTAPNPIPRLEQLGWLFIKKARESYDPGYYKLAEQCAACIESTNANSQEALLLRAHVLHSLHHFSQAETIARKLVAVRGRAFDYGVLGDVLIDVGKVDEAADAYQRMMDQRPDLQSYIRGAHLNWFIGRLSTALRLMQLATGAASPADSESAAWAYSRLALYQFQGGDSKKALSSCNEALSFVKDYAPALLIRGRILLAQHQSKAALADLEQAASLNPLPEYQWYLADAFRSAGREHEASEIESELIAHGATNDPRTLSVFLSTRNQQPDVALALARQELQVRQDIFTHDALAWALATNGNLVEARSESKEALKYNTIDARLLFHAGVIALKSGDRRESKSLLAKAKSVEQMLAPGERELLNNYLKTL